MQQRLCGREQEYGMVIEWAPVKKKRPQKTENDMEFSDNTNRGSRPQQPVSRDQEYDANGIPCMYRGMSSFAHGGAHSSENDLYRKEGDLLNEIITTIAEVVPAFVYNEDETWLSNGCRAYVDQQKIEISSAESSVDTMDMLAQEKATEVILERVVRKILKRRKDIKSINFYKNNVDLGGPGEDDYYSRERGPKERTYGNHQNYSYLANKYAEIVSVLRNFIPVSVFLSGNGHIARRPDGKFSYCFSQRAYYLKYVKNESTVGNRAIINTRDGFGPSPTKEKSNLARLHLIARDATRCEFQTWLVDNMTHLVMRLAEEGWRMPPGSRLLSPVKEIHALNSKISLNHKVKTPMGKIDIIEYNRMFLEAAKRLKPLSAMEKKCLREWERTLNLLKAKKWKKLVGELDWATKLWLLKIKMRKHRFGLNDPRAWKIAMNYHNISSLASQSWFARLDQRGYIRHLVSPQKIGRALDTAPKTRAMARSRLVNWLRKNKKYGRLTRFMWHQAGFVGGYRGIANGTIPFGDPENPFSPESPILERFLKKKSGRKKSRKSRKSKKIRK